MPHQILKRRSCVAEQPDARLVVTAERRAGLEHPGPAEPLLRAGSASRCKSETHFCVYSGHRVRQAQSLFNEAWRSFVATSENAWRRRSSPKVRHVSRLAHVFSRVRIWTASVYQELEVTVDFSVGFKWGETLDFVNVFFWCTSFDGSVQISGVFSPLSFGNRVCSASIWGLIPSL